jgi:mannose/cellobiose epimerase-like protein (N-acyl-D-glucosamine 2-epimerase family)
MTDARDKFKQWLTGTALPFWAAQGFDPSAKRFVERLDLSGVAVADAPFRLMVQARQVASFAMAALNGYGPPAVADMARAACDAMIRNYWQADGKPGWVFAVDGDGAVANAARDTYAHTFVLFALSWAYRLEPTDSAKQAEYRRLADQTLGYLDNALAVSGDRFLGYRTALPDPGGLSQNPHMHLFEALLSWFEASGEKHFLSRATALADLAFDRMIDPGTGALFEFYDDDWSPAAGVAGRIVEPGHCHEWAWLMLRYGRQADTEIYAVAERLYRFALTHGEDEDGLLFDQILPDGTVHQRGKRIWPQAEALKADAAFARLGDEQAGARIEKRVNGLFDEFLDRPIAGSWVDHRDADGTPKVGAIPASTLYHLAFTVEALDTAAKTAACR